MLSWVFALALVFAMSVAAGFGHVMPLSPLLEDVCLLIAVTSGTLFVATFEAYDTSASPSEG